MSESSSSDRREFLAKSAAVVAAGALAHSTARSAQNAAPAGKSEKRTRVGVIGCGSVSGHYLPELDGCPFVELVSVCDRIPERAVVAAEKYKLKHHYPSLEKMLEGEPFELLVDITDMQEHYGVNKRALEAGRNVWSEKPIGGGREQGQELLALAKSKGVRIWGAPIVVESPQFEFMARTLAAGTLGPISCAHASYGHGGPDWSAFFYETGGGSLPDLGIYNIATLTGLLGPARSVTAMVNVITPTRNIHNRGTITVTAEDNAMILMEHASGALSHVQCGFTYFTSVTHDFEDLNHHTIDIVGRDGSMHLCGYDWAPHGVDLATRDQKDFVRHATDDKGYHWRRGAAIVAECLATGREPLVNPEHAVHAAEIVEAARESQRGGRRITIDSTFRWPMVS